MKRCVRLGAVGALAVGFFMGAADWAAAEETQVNTYTVNAQGDPSVAMDADGDFVVTWESNGQSGGTFAMNDVYAQRFDSNGDPAGVEFAVWASSYNQQNPAAAMDGDGNFVIVLETDTNGSGRFGYPGISGIGSTDIPRKNLDQL